MDRRSNAKDEPTRRKLAARILLDGTWTLSQRALVERYGGRLGFTSRWMAEDVVARLVKAGLIPPPEGDKAFRSARRRYRGGYEVDRDDPAKVKVLYRKRA